MSVPPLSGAARPDWVAHDGAPEIDRGSSRNGCRGCHASRHAACLPSRSRAHLVERADVESESRLAAYYRFPIRRGLVGRAPHSLRRSSRLEVAMRPSREFGIAHGKDTEDSTDPLAPSDVQ